MRKHCELVERMSRFLIPPLNRTLQSKRAVIFPFRNSTTISTINCNNGSHLKATSAESLGYSVINTVVYHRYNRIRRPDDGIRSVRGICRSLTTAYSGIPSDGTYGIREKLPWIPYQTQLVSSNGCRRGIEVGPFTESEWAWGLDMMNMIIREGKTWPFEEEYTTVDYYRSYFLSHTAFVVRATEEGIDNNGNYSPVGALLGCFYIKPNFPGRCSHICNGGFITAPNYRQLGVARLMGHVFLQAAKDLGYQSSYFNLVFKSNTASVKIWDSLGFERVAVLKNAARLEGVPGLDTAYGYQYDLTQLPDNYLLNAYK